MCQISGTRPGLSLPRHSKLGPRSQFEFQIGFGGRGHSALWLNWPPLTSARISYKLRYIVGFWLVEMAISTNQKPTIYRNLYEDTVPDCWGAMRRAAPFSDKLTREI